jgi:hypothetical protein
MCQCRAMSVFGLQTLVPDRPDGGLPRRVTLRLKKIKDLAAKSNTNSNLNSTTSNSTTSTSTSSSSSGSSSASAQSSTSGAGSFVFQQPLTVQLTGSQPGTVSGVSGSSSGSSACAPISKYKTVQSRIICAVVGGCIMIRLNLC